MNNVSTWKGVWQQELFNILSFYQTYKTKHPFFFLRLLAFFFLVNAACYWLAVFSSFPGLLSDPVRMFKIQLTVALLGGLFDSLSFFITIWLIQQASKAYNGLEFAGILSVDLIIAVIATAWVLLVVLLATWLVGPPDEASIQKASALDLVQNEVPVEVMVESVKNDELADVSNTIVVENTVEVEKTEMTEVKAKVTAVEEMGAQEGEAVELRTSFYQDILVSAIKNPLDNFRYLLFGLIMGASTLLPTLFHLLMALRSLLLLRKYN